MIYIFEQFNKEFEDPTFSLGDITDTKNKCSVEVLINEEYSITLLGFTYNNYWTRSGVQTWVDNEIKKFEKDESLADARRLGWKVRVMTMLGLNQQVEALPEDLKTPIVAWFSDHYFEGAHFQTHGSNVFLLALMDALETTEIEAAKPVIQAAIDAVEPLVL